MDVRRTVFSAFEVNIGVAVGDCSEPARGIDQLVIESGLLRSAVD